MHPTATTPAVLSQDDLWTSGSLALLCCSPLLGGLGFGFLILLLLLLLLIGGVSVVGFGLAG